MNTVPCFRRRAAFLAAAAALAVTLAGDCRAQAPPPLKPGDTGPAVESLQRRLNARVSPAPGLDVDGDYGDATRAAVRAFQESKGLEASGVADEKTWAALGADPGPGPEPPPPAVVNARPPKKAPADRLDGPPFVTSKAWAVADGRTGELLWGSEADLPRDMASTTKIMTALVVLEAARKHPELLDEMVTFSERADRTGGSTAGVRAGEKLPLRELLYGLLLPSGNDASVALGEHVGARLGGANAGDPLKEFVAEMNRRASEMGLKETRFANTHGLTAADHKTSPRDLAKLAAHSLKNPTFAATVSTPVRGSTLTDAAGKTRNVVWKNTNRLLSTEGYDGVKTGTTSAAGNCLVASGRREGDHLIVAVLGSTSTEGRYADARNLFTWAWLKRGHGEEGFVSLLNGKDLSGWKVRQTGEPLDGKAASADGRFEADGGTVVIEGAPKIEDIFTVKEFKKNFILRLEFRAARGANSGLYIRGQQLQVRDYPTLGPYNDLKHYNDQGWNEIEVTVTSDPSGGGVARCTCNGELLEPAMKVPAEGGIGLQSETNRIDYRRIRIKELP